MFLSRRMLRPFARSITVNNLRLQTVSTAEISTNSQYDIIIAGGGMVGGAMACALGQSANMEGKRILVLDAGPEKSIDILKNPPTFYSNRVCAISPGNIRLLEKLNIWKEIPRSSSVKKMQVWDASSDGIIIFDQDHMANDLCRIVENDLVVAGINKILATDLKHKVEVLYQKKIIDCSVPRNYALEDPQSAIPMATVTLEDNTKLKTKLLIAADGFNSFVAKKAQLSMLKWEYGQSAVVATVELYEKTNNTVAWQRFLPTGPIALLPLSEKLSSLVWTTTQEHANQLVCMEENDFVTQVNRAFWQDYPLHSYAKHAQDLVTTIFPQNIGGTRQYPPNASGICGKRSSFPLGFSHANKYVKPRLAGIGDAIHRIHPLAGQGVNLGFRDVKCLVRTLEKAVYDGEDIGMLNYLLEYESERQIDNFSIAIVVNLLNHMYSTNNAFAVAVRSVGLLATVSSPFFKNQFMVQAMK